MKYLSLVTIRAFVVLGLSLGCAKASLSKAEIENFFKEIDLSRVSVLRIMNAHILEYGDGIVAGEQSWTFEIKEIKEIKKGSRKKIYIPPKLKVTFNETSVLFVRGNSRMLVSYSAIVKIQHDKDKNKRERIVIEHR